MVTPYPFNKYQKWQSAEESLSKVEDLLQIKSTIYRRITRRNRLLFRMVDQFYNNDVDATRDNVDRVVNVGNAVWRANQNDIRLFKQQKSVASLTAYSDAHIIGDIDWLTEEVATNRRVQDVYSILNEWGGGNLLVPLAPITLNPSVIESADGTKTYQLPWNHKSVV